MNGFKHATLKYIHTDNYDRLRIYLRCIEDEFYQLRIGEHIRCRRKGQWTRKLLFVDNLHAASIQQMKHKKIKKLAPKF